MANIHVPGFNAPAAGPEAPLEMLAACHQRIERQCMSLQRLALQLRTQGPDEPARQAAQNLMRYFDTAAHDHHADEEEDLFPALIESMAGSDAVCLRELTQGLTLEHRELEAAWRRVRAALAPIAAGEAAPLSPDAVDDFAERYRCHIEREEGELLPMAARLLSDDEIARVGQAMRKRRGPSDA